MEYVSGGFHPSEYRDSPIYQLVSLYREMRLDGLEAGLDPLLHPEYSTFGSIDEALGRCARIYSSIVAVKSADEEIEEFGLFKPSPKPQKHVKITSKEQSIQMSKVTRAKVDNTAVITVLVEGNPKKRTAAARFEKYKTGMTVQEYIDAIGGDVTLGVNDVLWDSGKGWIKWENPPSAVAESSADDVAA